MFDPEKVERVNIDNEDRHDIVLASDYDQLLQLYRDLKSPAQNDLAGAEQRTRLAQTR